MTELRNILCGLLFLISSAVCAAMNRGEARWIGPAGDDLPIYADYLPVFKIDCDVKLKKGDKASLVYGADDPRLMNRNLNIYNLENRSGESGIRVEIDRREGCVAIYRSGYHPADDATHPIAKFEADNLIDGVNHLQIASNLGFTDISINGKHIGHAGINPVGNGGDYLAFPVLARVAVDIPTGSRAEISNITVSNFRAPGNVIYRAPGVYTSSARVPVVTRSMPELRTVITLPAGKVVESAEATVTARGIYDISVNGTRVTDDYFYPGSTQYNKTHLYHTHDIAPLLREGDNTLSVQLAEGWWSGGSTFVGENWNFFGDRQSFIGVFTVRYTDGSVQRFCTEPGEWFYSTDGPVVEGSFFQGEIYDATRLDAPDRVWKPAVEVAIDSTVNKTVGDWDAIDFRPSFGDRVRAVDTVTARSVTEPRPGVYVYDMGQNMAAVPLISFPALKPGTEVSMRYAEVLYPDMPQYASHKGMIMTENLRAAMCRDIYRAAGTQGESFSPRFTLHGFRYIEVTGLEGPLPLNSVRAVPVSSVSRIVAGYECSDTLVNRLWDNICRSTMSNFVSIPTDCPQRNERLGWMGDISVYAPTATKIADVSAILAQYLASVRDCQRGDGKFPDVAPTGFGFGGMLWGSAGITVPWAHFSEYGDTAVLRGHYPAMKRYIDYLLKNAIDSVTGIMVQDRAWGDLADWLSPEYDRTDKSLMWECYFIYDLELMSRMAAILGERDDVAYYRQLADKRRDFFFDTYIDPATGKTRFSAFDPARKGQIIDTQASYALAIMLVDDSNPAFARHLVDAVSRENVADDGTVCPPYSLMTGFIGTAWIMEALSLTGNTDTAYRLLTSRNYPSWLYPVTQGATTVWERLNSYTDKAGFGSNNSMNSFNHYSFGAVGNWLLTRSAGLTKLDDKYIILTPEPDTTGAVTWARGWLDMAAGRAECSWRVDGDRVIYKVTVPDGVEAQFSAPVDTYDFNDVVYHVDGTPVPSTEIVGITGVPSRVSLILPAGRHEFMTRMPAGAQSSW